MPARSIIAIGASAGGFEAVQNLVSRLPADLHAAVFVTVHLFERSEGILPELLNRAGPLLAMHPWRETPIEMGRIYVAPPDYHLILQPGKVLLGHGPRENLQRPCINAMFRSAAAAYRDRVAGVLLTGLLDDGAAGLWEIQQQGGATIVQEPEEAAFRSMPESAIKGLNVQYILRIAEMAPLLTQLAMSGNSSSHNAVATDDSDELSEQACPECGGAMHMRTLDRLKEFSCHVGHRFGLKTMIAEKSVLVERLLWKVLSQSQELSQLVHEAIPLAEPKAASALKKELQQRTEEQRLIRDMLERERKPPVL